MSQTANATWKDKCTFLNPQNAGVEVAIGDQALRFYPVSVGKLFELRAIAQPLAESLMVMMSDKSADSGAHRSQDKDGNIEEAVMPPSVETLDARKRHQSEALRELFDALTDKKNLAIIGGILVDSLRELFSEDKPSGSEFIETIPAPLLPKFIKGLAEANKGVLGDLGGNASGLLETVIGKAKARTAAAQEASKTEEQSGPTTTG